MQPSSWHGVTTVVMGNCGVGFAPCRPDDHDRLVRLMEGVEDIPFPVLTEGLPWNWESYPDYLDALGERRFDVDIGSQLPHAALRVYVMGERGVDREPATEADIAAMAALAKQAMEAGAIGFATSRTLEPPLVRRLADRHADRRRGRAHRHRARHRGGAARACCRWCPTSPTRRPSSPCCAAWSSAPGRPLSFSLVQSPVRPAQLPDAAGQGGGRGLGAGLPIKAQVAARPVGVLFGLELTLNPFSPYPVYKEIAKRPLAERVALLRDPQFRERLLVAIRRKAGCAAGCATGPTCT